MKRKMTGILLLCCMVLLLPMTVFAGNDTGDSAVCNCETVCREDSVNLYCPVCADDIRSCNWITNPMDGGIYYSGDEIPIRWNLRNQIAQGDTMTLILEDQDGKEVLSVRDCDAGMRGANVLIPSLDPGVYKLGFYLRRPGQDGAAMDEICHMQRRIFINGGGVLAYDKTIDYEEGVEYDVTGLFGFSQEESADAAEYTLAGGTGEGVLNGTILEISAPGTFEVRCRISEPEGLSVTEATAVLTARTYTVSAPFDVQVVQGGSVTPGETVFTLLIFDPYDIKDFEKITVSASVSTSGPGSYSGECSITGSLSEIGGALDGGFFVRQTPGGEENWEYSDAVYYVTQSREPVVYTAGAGTGEPSIRLEIHPTIYEDGQYIPLDAAVDTMTFVNTYTYNTEAYTVKFDSRGGSQVSDQKVEKGNRAVRPSDPVKAGHTFAGWYTEETLTTAFSFEQVITQDITLYAKWSENSGTTETEEEVPEPQPQLISPKTGEGNSLYLWIGLLLVSGIAALSSVVCDKK